MMTGMIAVKSLVLIEEITFRNQTTVDVALFEIDGGLPVVLNVRYFFAAHFTERAMENQQLAVTEDDTAALKSRMELWLAVECSRHLSGKLALFQENWTIIPTVIARQEDMPHMLNNFGDAIDRVTSHLDPN